MTLKHISFHESEVMRSLERIAVKQGHFDPTPEEMLASAVYKINAAKKVQPTDNVMADLLTLASVLKERGYESQASELESKLGLYKTAETHLYRVHDEDGEDVLNFAHPESAVQMDERGSPFGKVFSPTEKARIIREVVKKEPSGKLAVAAAMLKKNAQEATNIDALEAAKTKVLSVVAPNSSAYDFSVDSILKSQDQNYLTAYATYAGVSLNDVIKIKKNIAEIYKGNFTANALYARIMATPEANYERAVNFGNSVVPGLGDKYFTGTQPGVDKSLAGDSVLPEFKADNPNSIWIVRTLGAMTGKLNKDSAKVSAAATEIHAAIKTLYDTVFGPLDEVNQKIEASINAALAPVTQIDSATATPKNIEVWLSNLRTLQPGGKNYKNLLNILKIFNSSVIDGFNTSVKELNDTLMSGVRSAEKTPDWWSPRITAGRYTNAANFWSQYAERLPENDAKRSVAEKNAKVANSLAAAVSNSVTFESLREAFKNILGRDFDTLHKIDKHSWESESFAKQQTGAGD